MSIEINHEYYDLQLAALWILILAIAYLKNPEHFVSDVENSTKPQNSTIGNEVYSEEIKQVGEKAVLCE